MLKRKNPPINMWLWVESHIYHSTREVDREWRDTLIDSLKTLATLIKHYTKIIEEEKQALEETLNTEWHQHMKISLWANLKSTYYIWHKNTSIHGKDLYMIFLYYGSESKYMHTINQIHQTIKSTHTTLN